MFGDFIRKTPVDSLSDLDYLFGNTISRLHVEPQIGYCERLIERSRYDLERTRKKKRAERLKKLIKAAEIEIDRLSTQTRAS